MPANALDRVVTFAGDVLFGRKHSTLTKPEATLGDRIDSQISGQPEEPETLNKKEATIFLISSLMKQLLKFPKKSASVNDMIKNHSQTNAEKVDYYTFSSRGSETHA